MRVFEHFWLSNEDWWHYDENDIEVINDDAPPEAQESYKIYLEQCKRASKEVEETGCAD